MPAVSLGMIPMMTQGPRPVGGLLDLRRSLIALGTPAAGIEVTRPQEVELYVSLFRATPGCRRLWGGGPCVDHQRALGELN